MKKIVIYFLLRPRERRAHKDEQMFSIEEVKMDSNRAIWIYINASFI